MKKSIYLISVLCLFVMASCSNKKINVETSEVLLHHGETFQIVAESDSPITYQSENEYNAVVDENGVVTANCIGETRIILNNGKYEETVKVVVEPLITTLSLPEIEVGESKSSVDAKYGQPQSEDAVGDGLTDAVYDYVLDGIPCSLEVIFDSDNKIYMYGLEVMEESYNPDFGAKIKPFVEERYMFEKASSIMSGCVFYMNATTIEQASMEVLSLDIPMMEMTAVFFGAPGNISTILPFKKFRQ